MTLAVPTYNTALIDWEHRIVNQLSMIPVKPLYKDSTDECMAIFKSLKVTDLAGMPTIGEVMAPWVLDFAAAIFGAYNKETGIREIEEFFLLISKKNGKSTLAAGIMLVALMTNWRQDAELLILAPTLENAKNCFDPASAMVRADPKLNTILKIKTNMRIIQHKITRAELKVVAATSNTTAGKKAAFILVDELWLFGKKADAAAMLEEATGGRATRQEGFVVYLSTHSDEKPRGVFAEKLEIFRNVRDGKVVDLKKMPVLYEFPERYLDEQQKLFLRPENWYITNPNLNRSVRADFIKTKLADAKTPQDERVAWAKWLNVEIGMGLRVDRWRGANHWAGAENKELAAIYKEDPFKALHRLIELSECVVLGADGGGLDDIFGFAALGRMAKEVEIEVEVFGVKKIQKVKPWLAWYHGWVHQDVLKDRPKIATHLTDFNNAQELTFITDKLEDLASIVELVKMIKEAGKLGGVGVDPAGLGELVELLSAIDVTEENGLLHGVPQGFGMMNSIKTTERHLARTIMNPDASHHRVLTHCGGDMMTWMVGNLKIEPTATAIRATKQTAGDAKIDCIMALFDAATVMVTNPQPFKKKEYRILSLT